VTKNKDYEVGYKKPPKNSQFKKGQSGNPAGRPKGKVKVANPAEVFGDVMAGLIPVSDKGRPRNITLLEAFFMSEVKKALKGENAAAKRLLSTVFTLLPRQPDRPAVGEGSDQDARCDLDQFLDEIAGRIVPAANDSEPRRVEGPEHKEEGAPVPNTLWGGNKDRADG
jgi:hypothetical protein